MGRQTKYKKKYAKELLSGIRRTPDITEGGREYGWSIERLTWRWGITTKTYYNWVEEFTSFREAHEIGERDFKIYWHQKIEDACHDKNMNGGVVKFAAANTIGWTDKKEVNSHVTTEEKITAININILPPPHIEELERLDSNVIEGKVIQIEDHGIKSKSN
jgi:hypothetical protein